ncbi:MAG: Na+/H+ antiporter NhaA [Peptococcaceae bacterium]|nr:Na+/H+ antiporter NhaA [Peptococcaceae bacterium]
MEKIIAKLREYSIPLLLGVVLAVLWTNLAPDSYHAFVHTKLLLGISFHDLVNDVFMVFFFGIAGVEIVRSMLPGGPLNPLKKAVTPLVATAGGILGPVAVFFALNAFMGSPDFAQGWAIPTATDIALAWLVARAVFGAKHPAVSFLLLLAVADDAVGLIIIAVFYRDLSVPFEPLWLTLVLAGMLLAFLLRKAKIYSFWPYILGGGLLAWAGMHNAHLHPALALVFIVPFLPHRPIKSQEDISSHVAGGDSGSFLDEEQNHKQPKVFEPHIQKHPDTLDHFLPDKDLEKGLYMPLDDFEHRFKPIVDFGLIAFGLSNAGVGFSTISNLTWIVLLALLVGKTGGVFLLGSLSKCLGFQLPKGMGAKELFVTGLVAAIGLTVALFVAEVAYTNPALQGAAKMGALFSAGAALLSLAMGRLLRIKRVTIDAEEDKICEKVNSQ